MRVNKIFFFFSCRAKPIPIFGNGDIMNYEDYNKLKEDSKVNRIFVGKIITYKRHGDLKKVYVFDT